MYFQLAKCVFSQHFQYRESIFFQFIGQLLRLYIQISIWKVLLQFRQEDMTFEEMVVYTTASLIFWLLTQSEVTSSLSEKVKSGSIAIDLIRPINLKWYTFWEQLSSNLFSLLFVGLPIVVIVGFVWPFAKLQPESCLLFVVSCGLAVVLSFYFQYVIGLLVFWFKDGTYGRMLIGGLMEIFSGKTIPLWFYPLFLNKICQVLPFRFMVYEPIAILLGKYGRMDAFFIMGMQILWIAVFWTVEKCIWHKVRVQIEVQGG